MEDLKKNRCRLCGKVFCCESCRLTHEIAVHNFNKECKICVTGKVFIDELSENLFDHIEINHLPLHCIQCKKIFKNIPQIFQYRKCNYDQHRLKLPKTPVTPKQMYENSPKLTPIYENIVLNQNTESAIVTSTPVVKNVETPIMRQELNKSKSIIKSIDSRKDSKRVTFSDTPIIGKNKSYRSEIIESPTNCTDVYYSLIESEDLTGSTWHTAFDQTNIDVNNSDIWFTVLHLINTMLDEICSTSHATPNRKTFKRTRSDTDLLLGDDENRLYKRRKFAHMPHRRTMSGLLESKPSTWHSCDKSTQTSRNNILE